MSRSSAATPQELRPDPEIVAQAGELASWPTIPREAAAGAHALYTDVWVSMGDEADASRRRELLAPYRLDAALLAQARDDAVVMHCLPAHPGEEITEDLLYGERSAVWDQAENRLHAQKALMERLLPDLARTFRAYNCRNGSPATGLRGWLMAADRRT